MVDPEAIERDRNLLWAEGIRLYGKNGVLFLNAEELARDIYGDFELENPLIEEIKKAQLDHVDGGYCKKRALLLDEPFIRISDIMKVLDVKPEGYPRIQPRVTAAMRKLGYQSINKRFVEGEPPFRAWVKASAGSGA